MSDLSHAEFLHYTLKRTDSTFYIERQRLTYLDLTFLIAGEMVYYYNDEEIHLRAGDAILFPPGSIRQRQATPTPVRYASINVRPDAGFVAPIAGHLPGCVTASVLMILELMADTHHAPGEAADKQCLALFQYLHWRLVAESHAQQNPYIKSMQRYISEHISDKLTLGEIAEAVHLTPEYCCALFKKTTGKTVFSYILDQRIETAKRLITLGELSLKTIAGEMGFADYNYFSRTFKRITGLTPSEYRQMSLSPVRPRAAKGS